MTDFRYRYPVTSPDGGGLFEARRGDYPPTLERRGDYPPHRHHSRNSSVSSVGNPMAGLPVNSGHVGSGHGASSGHGPSSGHGLTGGHGSVDGFPTPMMNRRSGTVAIPAVFFIVKL